MWITGYSRAGATTNLVAAELKGIFGKAGNTERNVFAYTFEAPQPTKLAKNAAGYGNIHNVVNPIDIVPKVVMSAWGYARYGQTHWLPSAADAGFARLAQKNGVRTRYENLLKAGNYQKEILFPMNSLQAQKVNEVFDAFARFLGAPDSDKTMVLSYIVQQYYLDKYGKPTSVTKSDVVKYLASELLYANGNPIDAKIGEVFGIETVGLFQGIGEPLYELVGAVLQDAVDAGVSMEDLQYFVDRVVVNGVVRMGNLKKAIVQASFDTLKRLLEFVVSRLFVIPHYPELTMSLLDASPEDRSATPLPAPRMRLVRVDCPVDVKVYDAENRLVAETAGEKSVPVEGSSIGSSVEATGTKVFALPGDGEYRVEITATGGGTMDYTVQEYDYGENTCTLIARYQNVPLKKGDVFTGAAPVCQAGRDTAYTLTYGSGEKTVGPAFYRGEQARLMTVTASPEGAGSCTPRAYGYIGDRVVLTAYPEEGSRFLGWYQDGRRLSALPELTVTVAASGNGYVCRFGRSGPSEPPVAYLPGDVSQDGEVKADDARLALRAAVGLESFEKGSARFLAADATGDGEIRSEDARLILRAAVGLEDPARWQSSGD